MKTKITRRRRVLLGVLVLASVGVTACQRGVMWTPCATGSDGNPFGMDKTHILHCRDGEWVPVMTIEEYSRLQRGERGFALAPLPKRPTTRPTPAPTRTPSTSIPSSLPPLPSLPSVPAGAPPSLG
jgi:hypothetical protein